MRLFDAGGDAFAFIAVGQHATGVIAFGQFATGVIAIGQVATGFVAIGQLARGVFVIGQLALGVAAFGQLVVALTYGGGMVGVAGLRTGASLLVWGVAGHGHIVRNGRISPTVDWFRAAGASTGVRIIVMGLIAVAVAVVALGWIPGYVADGVDAPVEPTPEPPPTTFAPGTR